MYVKKYSRAGGGRQSFRPRRRVQAGVENVGRMDPPPQPRREGSTTGDSTRRVRIAAVIWLQDLLIGFAAHQEYPGRYNLVCEKFPVQSGLADSQEEGSQRRKTMYGV